MHFKKSIVVAALSLAANSAHAWTLAYAHDANGSQTSGSLEVLSTAANNGASVKVIISIPGSHTLHIPCEILSVREDSTSAVVCTNSTLRSSGLPGPSFGTTIGAPQSAYFTINTMGQYAHTNIRIGDGGLVSHTIFNYAMKWYIE
jgi:hypothetical protein